MQVRCAVAVLILSAGMLAQSPPPACPADRPVDDILAELNKQSKKNTRNRNPLPDVICIWSWCREVGRPPKAPEPAPRAETPSETPGANDGSSSGVSSSKRPADKCNEAMEMAFEAAHDVEVGDDHFKGKNYKGALWRYQDALKKKPEDAAIHVRLGRVSEKLNDLPQAIDHYRAAEKLGAPEKWAQEAHGALLRLERSAPASK